MLLAAIVVLGTFSIGRTVLERAWRSTAAGSAEDHPDVHPEITTAENIRWTRCEEDESMFCTTFT